MKGYREKKRLTLTFSFFLKATYDKALRVLKRAEEDNALDTTDGGMERGSPGDSHFHRRPLSTQQATSLPAPPPGLACGVFGPRASSPVATGAARSSFVFDHQLPATTPMITALSPPTNDAGRPASCASDCQPPATVPALTGCFESRVIKLLLEQRQQLRELTQQNAALKEGQEELCLRLAQLEGQLPRRTEPAGEAIQLPLFSLEEFQAAEEVLQDAASRKALSSVCSNGRNRS
ncbi:unnamed protein product [Ixodes persulcatus]